MELVLLERYSGNLDPVGVEFIRPVVGAERANWPDSSCPDAGRTTDFF